MVKVHTGARVLRPSVDHADSAVTVSGMDPLCTIQTMTVQISAVKKQTNPKAVCSHTLQWDTGSFGTAALHRH